MNQKRAKKIKNDVIIALYGEGLSKKEKRSALQSSSTKAMYRARKNNYTHHRLQTP